MGGSMGGSMGAAGGNSMEEEYGIYVWKKSIEKEAEFFNVMGKHFLILQSSCKLEYNSFYIVIRRESVFVLHPR